MTLPDLGAPLHIYGPDEHSIEIPLRFALKYSDLSEQPIATSVATKIGIALCFRKDVITSFRSCCKRSPCKIPTLKSLAFKFLANSST
uniref:Uncharacterized protein n=1 Tax=Romanomermis culicivorax TaxID=13658 RepID=A0A915JES5_ROMCU